MWISHLYQQLTETTTCQWKLVVLGVPQSLLMLRGEKNVKESSEKEILRLQFV